VPLVPLVPLLLLQLREAMRGLPGELLLRSPEPSNLPFGPSQSRELSCLTRLRRDVGEGLEGRGEGLDADRMVMGGGLMAVGEADDDGIDGMGDSYRAGKLRRGLLELLLLPTPKVSTT